jgi:hypothetical protein
MLTAKIDHSSIDESRQRQIAADIIDIVEGKIRSVHPEVEAIAANYQPEPDDDKPNTLLYGENYYDLEDKLTELLVDNFNRKPKCVTKKK